MVAASRWFLAALAALCALTSVAIPDAALATPITVNLRVEGSTRTLFEGNVTTSPETIQTASSGGAHPCNYAENGPSGGFVPGGSQSGTPTTALHDAALATGLSFDAEWFGSGAENGNPGDFFVSRVGNDVNQTEAPFDSWGYAVNFTTASVGGCQIALAPGNEVLWAYNYFNLSHLLSAAGPVSVNAGTPFTVHVADGHTGEAIAGAAVEEAVSGVPSPIAGSSHSDANGDSTVVLNQPGVVTLKATRADSVRSNGLVVCVHAGSDGTCGSTLPAPAASGGPIAGGPVSDVARIAGIRSGRVYSRRFAPRVLSGKVQVPPGGTLRDVRIRLERRHAGRCFFFSGSRVRFVRTRRCRPAPFFSVGGSQSFSYLLPARLPRGRYVYDIEAISADGTATKLVDGVSHVVFRVR
ncbi:MAG: hypothetical protein E6G34_12410 [Actinobacteria bacterium]|nr:MAG: hypothetical protein E6G34_12410 [Actinomycetota bacterium]